MKKSLVGICIYADAIRKRMHNLQIGERGLPMNHWGEMVLVVIALGMSILIQLRVSKMRSSVLGLILPFLIFFISIGMLLQDLKHIREGSVVALTSVKAFLYFALYNIPTILFLCIYNYYQRARISRRK